MIAAPRRHGRRRGGPAVTFCFTSMFTFRYYLLHTRVGLGQVPQAFKVQRDDRYFYLGDFRAFEGVQAAVDELDRLAKPGDRLLVGPSDLRRTWYSDAFIYWLFPELEPATYYIEMDPGLANEPRVEPRRRRRLGRLRHPHRAVGRLDGAQHLDGLRLRRPEPGAARPLLRGRRLHRRPGRPVPPLPLTSRVASRRGRRLFPRPSLANQLPFACGRDGGASRA